MHLGISPSWSKLLIIICEGYYPLLSWTNEKNLLCMTCLSPSPRDYGIIGECLVVIELQSESRSVFLHQCVMQLASLIA